MSRNGTMNVRTFQAGSMAEVLAMVKQQLGRDAVILHTRTVRRGGVLGFGAREMVEVTASNEIQVPPQRRPAAEPSAPVVSADLDAQRRRVAAPLLHRTYQQAAGAVKPPADTSSAALARALSASIVSASGSKPKPPVQPRPAPAVTDPQLSEELRQIRQLVQRMARQQASGPRPDLPENLFNRYLALLEQEVSEELAEEVVRAVRERLEPEDLSHEARVKETLAIELARLIPTDPTPHTAMRRMDGRPLTIALIGPTGVGKTTTIAKLAASFKLRDRRKVALITADTYRIAAVDQLRTYAGIIDLPLHVVLTPDQMQQALQRCAAFDVVLIDTAGRSQRDDGKLQQLRQFIEAATPHEVHLVLSSTCAQSVMMEQAERFSDIAHDRIIFTKLDEAVSFGVLLNVMRRVNKKLSYITTGQEVPHQIEPGRSDRMAQLIMGEGI